MFQRIRSKIALRAYPLKVKFHSLRGAAFSLNGNAKIPKAIAANPTAAKNFSILTSPAFRRAALGESTGNTRALSNDGIPRVAVNMETREGTIVRFTNGQTANARIIAKLAIKGSYFEIESATGTLSAELKAAIEALKGKRLYT